MVQIKAYILLGNQFKNFYKNQPHI